MTLVKDPRNDSPHVGLCQPEEESNRLTRFSAFTPWEKAILNAMISDGIKNWGKDTACELALKRLFEELEVEMQLREVE